MRNPPDAFHDTSFPASAAHTPMPVSGGLAFTRISSGSMHTCGVTRIVGRVYCWGSNAAGRLGTATAADQLVPAPVAPFGEVPYFRSKTDSPNDTVGAATDVRSTHVLTGNQGDPRGWPPRSAKRWSTCRHAGESITSRRQPMAHGRWGEGMG